jgi:glycosyltransferase involved in cell wall biosynthesis
MAKQITYIISGIDNAIAFEWIANKLNKNKFQLHFILLNSKKSELEAFLTQQKIPFDSIPFKGKKDYPKVFLRIILLLIKNRPHIIHTHLFDANLIGLTAAKVCGIKKRIYTRHHATFHFQYFPKAVKYDRWCNFMATDIVAISQNVKNVLIHREKVSESKIHLIHHGFDLNAFKNVDKEQVLSLENKYNIDEKNRPRIGVISRYLELKGIEYAISAFEKTIKQYPQALIIFANANGSDKAHIQSLIQKKIPPQHYREILFEPNLFALYKMFDIHWHLPINNDIEAFGQTYVEALAAGIPSVFTLSGVANEFIVNRENAMVVDYKNSNQVYEATLEILTNNELKNKIIKNGIQSVQNKFELDKMIVALEQLYEK